MRHHAVFDHAIDCTRMAVQELRHPPNGHDLVRRTTSVLDRPLHSAIWFHIFHRRLLHQRNTSRVFQVPLAIAKAGDPTIPSSIAESKAEAARCRAPVSILGLLGHTRRNHFRSSGFPAQWAQRDLSLPFFPPLINRSIDRLPTGVDKN